MASLCSATLPLLCVGFISLLNTFSMTLRHHCIVDDWTCMAQASLHLSLLLPAPLPLPWPAVAAGEGQSDLAARGGNHAIHSTTSMSYPATTMRTAGRNYKVVLSCVSKVILITLNESKAIYIYIY